jgi:hypothetical protein
MDFTSSFSFRGAKLERAAKSGAIASIIAGDGAEGFM